MKTAFLKTAALMAAVLLLAACGRSEEQRLVLTGSSTIAPLAAVIAQRFEARHPGVKIDVQAGGSSRGINDARQGLARLGMVSRALKAEEGDLRAAAIARDGIALIVHKDNPVATLSREQIVAIYTGSIRDWRTVGGPPGPITVVNKAEGRSTLELFLNYLKLDAAAVRADVVIGDNQQGIKTVAGNPLAIGYVSIGSAEYEAGHGSAIRPLPMDGVEASVAAVRGARFPLARPLNLVYRGELKGLAREFVDFASSPEVDDLVAGQYFVPVGIR